MGIGTIFKANKAMRAQRNGDSKEAIRLLDECVAEGLKDMRFLLPYSTLLIRDGQFQKAKDFLVEHQRTPGMTAENRNTLLVNYAVCCYKLGDVDKAVARLEEAHRKGPNGTTYQILGYLYVEQFDPSRKEEYIAKIAKKRAEEEARRAAGEPLIGEDGMAEKFPEYVPENAEQEGPRPVPTPEEMWEAGRQKTLAYNRSAVAYDDEDSICLDNLGQTYYRVIGDREEARTWFEKAHALKPEQIDTLYFLSRYDLEAGDRKAALEKMEKALEGRFSPLNYCTRAELESEIRALKGGD